MGVRVGLVFRLERERHLSDLVEREPLDAITNEGPCRGNRGLQCIRAKRSAVAASVDATPRL
jgi:hypothetical protein